MVDCLVKMFGVEFDCCDIVRMMKREVMEALSSLLRNGTQLPDTENQKLL